MALGLVAFILYLWFFVGFDGLLTLLSQINVYQYSLFLALAVGALFAAVIFDSLIWHSLLDTLSVKVKLSKLVLYNWIGTFIELIIPSATIGGEVARIALAQKETKHNTGIAAATVIGSRIISTFVYSGGLRWVVPRMQRHSSLGTNAVFLCCRKGVEFQKQKGTSSGE